MKIANCLDLSGRSILAVTGCGGKSSFVELVAESCRNKKVLISPTTKIFPIRRHGVALCGTVCQCVEHTPRTGIQCLGVLNTENNKLEALPERILADMIPYYDIALLEADGSRGLPCKGWLPNEPVIPDYCTHTVGIITMNALGITATASAVHNLPEFLALTGLMEGEAITLEALEAMACASGGMFRKSRGRQYLLVNQTEEDAVARKARKFLQSIKEKYPGRFAGLFYGSVYENNWREV